MNTSDFEEKYFDSGIKVSGQYSSYERERFFPAFNAMVQVIQETLAPSKLLDVGCAKGYLVEEFRNNKIEAFGVDVSVYAINNSPEPVRDFLKVVDLNNEKLPYPDNSFDTIICMGTLEYIKDQNHAIYEIKRVLKQEGTLLMTTLASPPLNDKLRVYAHNRDYWISIFNNQGYFENTELGPRVFSHYLKKIIEFDYLQALATPGQKTFKQKIGRTINKLGGLPILIDYLFKRQVKDGYTMLAFTKRVKE